ncbi:MAG: hypothetical protein R3E66_22895 [bacterium]
MMRIGVMLSFVVVALVGCDSSSPTSEPDPCDACGTDTTCINGACVPNTCGDGVLGDDETCDSSANVPCDPESYCEAPSACVLATYTGSVETCTANCTTQLITECINDDGCCASGCNPVEDNDCRPELCGNGVLDDGETCDDPQFPCPTSCPADACATVSITGLAQACNAACTSIPITECYPMPDGCCPTGCGVSEDADCQIAACGNGVLDAGEMCDTAIGAGLAGSCPTVCEDNRACTTQTLMGDGCGVMCATTAIGVCVTGDGCCPAGCDVAADGDCAAVVCGDGIVDGDETCDNALTAGEPGACETAADCDDQNPCTTDTFVGMAADCSAQCVHQEFACMDNDQCCPTACTSQNDTECAALSLCDTYCANAELYCSGANQLYATTEACMTACQAMPIGTPDEQTGPTLSCRLHHLMEAANDPDTHCAHAAETPTEACI